MDLINGSPHTPFLRKTFWQIETKIYIQNEQKQILNLQTSREGANVWR